MTPGIADSAPAAGAPGAAEPKPSTPEAEVTAALKDVRRLLQEKDYRTFIEKYMPIEVLRRIRAEGKFETAVAQFEQDAEIPAQFIAAIDAVAGGEITFNESGTEATLSPSESSDETTSEPTPATPVAPETTNIALRGFGPDLGGVIDQALAALEAGEVAAFIDNMFPAGELRRPDAERLREQMLARLTPDSPPVQQMISDLKALQNLSPTLNDAGDVAEFELPAAEDGLPARAVMFQKVENSWRLYDSTTSARREIARFATLPLRPLERVSSTFLTFEKDGDSWRLKTVRF